MKERMPSPERRSGSAAQRPAGPRAPRYAFEGSSIAPPRGPKRALRAVHNPRAFGRSLALTLLSALIPGLGLVGTRWRRFGWLLTAVAATALGATVAGGFLARNTMLALATNPGALTILWVGLALFGILWVTAVVATHLLTRPRPPTGWHRVGGAAIVGILAFAVALPTFVGARSVYDTAVLIRDVFHDSDDPGEITSPDFGTATDPWARKPRLNVLMLGGDAGADRVGTRTDTVIVASVNTRTGDTVLYSLPRQTLRLPFPAGTPLHQRWPRGFYLPGQDELESSVSAMYENVPNLAKEAIPPAKDPGAKVLQIAVGEALGLHIDYYTMVNLDGFVELVNALGGITVNINKPVPVGGKNPTRVGGSDAVPPDRWLAPGPNQHLNGYDALWYARGRYQTTDYDRMSRQRCVIQAMSHQANPGNVLANYEALTKAGKNIVQTDVPNSLLPALLDLAIRVREKPLRAVSFEHGVDGFSTTHPDWELVRSRVNNSLEPPAPQAVAPSVRPATPPTTPSAPPSKKPGAGRTPSASVTPSTTPEPVKDVADECAWDPTAWTPGAP